jgi:hypothetical protein
MGLPGFNDAYSVALQSHWKIAQVPTALQLIRSLLGFNSQVPCFHELLGFAK